MPTQKVLKKKHVEYHRDGSIRARGQTIAGVLTGHWEWFRKDGTKLRSGRFVNGQQVGEWITYDKQGQIYKVTTIKPKPESPPEPEYRKSPPQGRHSAAK